jgi:hypothetical protein
MVRRRPVFSAVLGTVAGILILASGCADQSPTAVQVRPAKALSAAKAYQSGSFTMSIDPSGGTFSFPIGHISFPAGAVSETTTITATLDGRTLAVEFEPHMMFPDGAQPTLAMSVTGLKVNFDGVHFLHVADDGATISTFRPIVENGIASINVEGFSRWILAAD